MITFTTTFKCDSCPRGASLKTVREGEKQHESLPLSPHTKPVGWQLQWRRPKLLCDICVKVWRKRADQIDDVFLGKMWEERWPEHLKS